MEQFKKLPTKDLHASKTNPRKHFDKKQMDDLILSIKEKSIVVPLLVRTVEHGYEVVAGERRFRAAQELKLEEVPCIVRDLTDEQALEIQVIENLQREDVHPLDEAEGFAQLMAKGNYTPEMIGGKVGKSVSWVYQSLKLNDLIPELKEKFWKGDINRSHGLLLSRVPAEIQKEVAKNAVNGYKEVSLINIRHAIDKCQISLSSGGFKKDDESLLPSAGACNQCNKRTGFHPSLFPELKKNDMCLDTKCFYKKLELFTKQKVEELEEKGLTVVGVEGTSYPRIKTEATKSVVERWSYSEIKDKKEKKKSGVVTAVIVSDDRPERIGQVMSVTLSKKESGRSYKLQRPNKAQLLKMKIECEAMKIIRNELMKKVNIPVLPQSLYAAIVRRIAGGYKSNAQFDFYRDSLGEYWEKCKGSDSFEKKILDKKTSVGELHKIAIASMIFSDSGMLDDFAAVMKINAKGIREKMKIQLTPKAEPKNKATKKTAKK
jgi:ParB/RepB/Spo0J family partition protein